MDLEWLVSERIYHKKMGRKDAFTSLLFCCLGSAILSTTFDGGACGEYLIAFGSYTASGLEFSDVCYHWKKFKEVTKKILEYKK